MKKEQYKVLKRLCNQFEKTERFIKNNPRWLIINHEEQRKNYKVFKSLCNKYEHEQRKEEKLKLEDFVDLYYNGYYLYALDKTENRADLYLKMLYDKYNHLDIILDLTTCNSNGVFNGEEIYLFKNHKLKQVKNNELINNIVKEYRNERN